MSSSAPEYYSANFRVRKPTKIRSTATQIRYLIEYMAANPDLVTEKGQSATSFTAHRLYKKWEILAHLLKQHGPDKNITQWKHTWRDLKRKARDEYAKLEKNDDDKDITKFLSHQTNSVMEAIQIAEAYDPKDEDKWSQNNLWIDPDQYTVENSNVAELKQDPLFESVEYLEQDGSEQEDEQNDDDDEEDDSEETPTKPPQINVRPNATLMRVTSKPSEPPSLTKRPNTGTPNQQPPQKIIRPAPAQEPTRSNVTVNKEKQGSYSDIDVLNTLNKFIDYEKEKDKLAHEREMTRIQQTNRMLSIMEKISDVFENMAPSIKKCLDKDGNGYR